MNELENIIGFMIEIERLKSINRKSMPIGMNRYENSAEHSWHVCISALMLKDYANKKIDINRVIKMLLIHDLGEIDAGDKIIYESEQPHLKDNEAKGVSRLLNRLPEHMRVEYMDLWYEFENGETDDSIFARAIDRIPPLLHNIYGNGHTWKKYKISEEQIMKTNKRIELGSKSIWEIIRSKIRKAIHRGVLNEK